MHLPIFLAGNQWYPVDILEDIVLWNGPEGRLMDKFKIITSAEEQFAREVTLGVMIHRPLPAWLYIIPGIFFLEYLRRGTAIRRYTETFMFPRKLALQAAKDLLNGFESASVDRRIETEISAWLESHHLAHPDLSRAQKSAVGVLIEHYSRLLQSDGGSYYDLIEATYKSRYDFKEYLNEITEAEREVDRVILAVQADSEKLKIKLEQEEQQVAERRGKILEAIY